MNKILLFPLVLVFMFTLYACNDNNESEHTIYVTSYPVMFILESLSEGIADVRYVPGSQQHGESIDWAAQDIIAMQDADFLFYVGGGLDPYIDSNMTSTFEGEQVNMVKLEDYINYIDVKLIHDHDDHNDHDDHDDEDIEEMPDPHFWLDPNRMIEASEIVYDYLKDYYEEESQQNILDNNYVKLSKQLEKLLDDYNETLDNPQTPLITNVKLFTYFERAFDVEIYPFTLNSHAHEDESIPTDYEAFIELAQDYDIQYVIFEKNAASPAGETLLSELRDVRDFTERLELHPLERLTNDELIMNHNYITIMYENLETLEMATE